MRHDGLVHIGTLTITPDYVIARPCRGITNRQRLQLLGAYKQLVHQDVWDDQLTTYVSVRAVSRVCAVEMPKGTKRRAWTGSRYFRRRYGRFIQRCPAGALA